MRPGLFNTHRGASFSTSAAQQYRVNPIQIRKGIPGLRPGRHVCCPAGTTQVEKAEDRIVQALNGAKGRGRVGLSKDQIEDIESAAKALEQGGGCQDPTLQKGLSGKWRLLYTSRPGTASPIQRTFVDAEAFTVFQNVDLQGGAPLVSNVVDFGPRIGYLKVEAEASTDSRPLQGFTPRSGAGLPIFGKSITTPPSRRNLRIDFQFSQAAFRFVFLPFSIPYPVPFRILGDERKGWIDITYLNEACDFRLSRGNKGTLFILVKEDTTKGG